MNISLQLTLDRIAEAQAAIHLGQNNYPEYIDGAKLAFSYLDENDLDTRHGRYAKRLMDALEEFNEG
jgi:hypothetical protein